ncbi:MAG: hypothetical protein KAG96_03345 [Ichthyobacteriaceae bacterium]|nr:hypothetical protein [Ichthyobacteriaceae bacterium]
MNFITKSFTFVMIVAIFLTSCNQSKDYFTEGFKLINSTQFKKALIVFNDGLNTANVNAADMHYGKAVCNFYLKNYNLSSKELEEVINVDDKYANAYWLLGRIYSLEGNVHNALLNFDNALDISENSDLLSTRGWELMMNGDYEMALMDLNKSIRLQPNNAYAYSNRGWVKVKLGNLIEAKKDLDKSIELNAENAYAYKHMAMLYVVKDDTLKACEYLFKTKRKGGALLEKEFVDGLSTDDFIDKYCN